MQWNSNIRITGVVMLLMMTHTLAAQHQEVHTPAAMWKGKQQEPEDTNSILYAFKKGQFHGNFRYFFMATDNREGLSDYYANAAGGGIKFETASFRHFQMGLSGYFIFNIGSSDLSKPDAATHLQNRYEIGLFDITDPLNKRNIDRLEELYLKYSWKKSHLTFGKQLINTPFINLQDGRMRPTEVGGLYGEMNDIIPGTKIEGGYLYEISPRSTVRWYKVAESIGVYAQGVNADGTKSNYAGNLASKGIVMLGGSHTVNTKLTIKAYDVWVENMFNSFLLEADGRYPIGKKKAKLVAGGQYIRQDVLHDGGNADPDKTYFRKGGSSMVFGFKLGWENERWQGSLNYTRITAAGRYLMPREWGRDPFFTFMPRERNDGLGDVHAVVARLGYELPKAHMKINLAAGYVDLPDVKHYALNKYGLPSYYQLNTDIRYEFSGMLKGLDAQVLWVYKGKKGNTYGNGKYVLNKVDMMNWNMMLNYHF
ncbi:MAG: OprD family outer membrane porin [Bacteroidetes bacterium]|nr:OprD family outer membrane porin [Bacteroidota bacterium]